MKRSSLGSRSRAALAFAMTVGLAAFVPVVLAQSPGQRQQAPVERFRTLFELSAQASAEGSGLEGLSGAELEAVKQILRERSSEARKAAETASANEVVGSTSVVARCAEGWVASTGVRKSASDVEILSEERVACDESGCKAVQVNARRASQEPFTLVVSVACNS
jgi:hypothetical protein